MRRREDEWLPTSLSIWDSVRRRAARPSTRGGSLVKASWKARIKLSSRAGSLCHGARRERVLSLLRSGTVRATPDGHADLPPMQAYAARRLQGVPVRCHGPRDGDLPPLRVTRRANARRARDGRRALRSL